MRGSPWLCFNADEYLDARSRCPGWADFEKLGFVAYRDFGRGQPCIGVNVDRVPSEMLDALRTVAAQRRQP
jgi:hypothetical protein